MIFVVCLCALHGCLWLLCCVSCVMVEKLVNSRKSGGKSWLKLFAFFVLSKAVDGCSETDWSGITFEKKNRKLATQSTDFGRARAGSCSRKGRERSRLGRVVLGPVWGFRGGAARVLEMLIPAVVWFGEKRTRMTQVCWTCPVQQVCGLVLTDEYRVGWVGNSKIWPSGEHDMVTITVKMDKRHLGGQGFAILLRMWEMSFERNWRLFRVNLNVTSNRITATQGYSTTETNCDAH